MTTLVLLGAWSVASAGLCLLLGAVIGRREQARQAPPTAPSRALPRAVPRARAADTAVVPTQDHPSPALTAPTASTSPRVGSPS